MDVDNVSLPEFIKSYKTYQSDLIMSIIHYLKKVKNVDISSYYITIRDNHTYNIYIYITDNIKFIIKIYNEKYNENTINYDCNSDRDIEYEKYLNDENYLYDGVVILDTKTNKIHSSSTYTHFYNALTTIFQDNE